MEIKAGGDSDVRTAGSVKLRAGRRGEFDIGSDANPGDDGIGRYHGPVIEPDTGIAAIGSGGPYAQAAAQALAEHTQLSARQIAEEAMKIAGKMCIYTNDRVTIEEL